MKILYYRWTAFTREDIAYTFRKMGVDFDEFTQKTEGDVICDDRFMDNLRKKLNKTHYDAVFSVNYIFRIAEVCHDEGIPYLAWSYDSPNNYGDYSYLGYDTTYIFVFDRQDYLALKERIGAAHAFHLPLAVSTDRLDRIYCSANERKKYRSQISFVGQLYTYNSEDALNTLPDYEKGYLNALRDAQFNIYGGDIIFKALDSDFMERISTPDFMEATKRAVFQERRNEIKSLPAYALWMLMYREISRRERILLLELLGKHFDTALFSYDEHEALDNVRLLGSVDYISEMPKVFKCSDINLNISLRSIMSGIPQRCLDIMGSDTFLLSNFQPELAEFFEDGKDCAIYSSIEEALDKCSYYIKHDVERKRIAHNGYYKCRKEFNFEKRLQTIFEKAGIRS